MTAEMTADTPQYLGLTWNHPRGYRALEAAAAADAAINLHWERQSLEGFESHPIAELAQRYDLIVLDHPHLGDAVAAQCLVPLQSLFGTEEIAAWAAASVGRSFASYRYAGDYWALPLDAATQVSAFRPDLLQGESPPATWEAAITLAQRQPVCLSLAGPHAALTFMSLCAALGEPAASRDPEQFVGAEIGGQALAIMSAIYRHATKVAIGKNPIGILEAMAQGAEIAYCPLIYGYVNYAVPAPGRYAVRFGDVPVARAGGTLGSTLGGTGLALTRRAEVTSGLLAHLRFLMNEQTQRCFIPCHDGQPSARGAWRAAEVNSRWGNFYRDTLATIEAAWVRPRYANFVMFQAVASASIRGALDRGTSAASLLGELQQHYAASRRAARGGAAEL
jgi:multiple sugar transport system substrate-binding protein